MNIGNAFPSSYLKASDLQGKSVNIAMHSVTMEEVGGEHKPVLYFAAADGSRKDRGIVLNKTNSSIIAEMYGWETEDWPGKVITLYPARVEFQGRIVDAIRIKLDVGTHMPKAASQAPIARAAQVPTAPTNGNGVTHIDDAIPF